MNNNVIEILPTNTLYGWAGLFLHWDWYKNQAGDKDFKRSELAARVWGERKFLHWLKRLENHEKVALAQYTKTSTDINPYLRENKGIILDQGFYPDWLWEQYEINNNKIRSIDSALQKNKTEKVMQVYRRVNEQHFYEYSKIMTESLHIRNLQGKINQKVFLKIMTDFIVNKTEYQDHAYVSTSLTQDPVSMKDGMSHRPFILKIKVPKNTNAAYLGFEEINEFFVDQREVLLNRGYYFKYQDAKIISDKCGRESVLIKVDLIPS